MNPHPPAPITLDVVTSADRDERVPLSTLGKAASGYGALLERVTLEQSGAKPAVRWVIQELGLSSIHLAVAPLRLVEEAERIEQEVAELVIDGLDRVEHGEDVEEVFSPEAADAARTIVELLRSDVVEMVVRHHDRQVMLTRDGAGQREPTPEPYRTSIGAVEGVLKAISLSGTPYFMVYRPTGGPGVKCFFDRGRYLKQVVEALLERVVVSGRVTRRDDGSPIAVRQITELRLLGRREDLPRVDDIIGIEPDLTEGLPSERWLELRRQRG